MAASKTGPSAKILQKAQVRIINNRVCKDLLESWINDRMLCAGILTGGVDACQVRTDPWKVAGGEPDSESQVFTSVTNERLWTFFSISQLLQPEGIYRALLQLVTFQPQTSEVFWDCLSVRLKADQRC
ncbi:hypothetical protein ATANTOWER_031795 [Ataeniobius toweri]|uniref:Peptidase S1 domain-containing protein n=1 Tax=Ataeniobius toweri TaxID=208326 RepID=A0ABU7BLE0_9TELE|nr:hypothetical protein [Ataeniobius toweri]